MKAQTCPFGMIMTSCLGKMLDKAKNQGKPRRYLRNINVRWFGFDLSDVQEMRVADDEVERYSIRKGDLVVCEGGEPGRCAIWSDEETVCFQKALHRIRFNETSDPRFYMYYLWVLAKSGMLAAYYTGTGIKHLTGESLKKLPVPVPPLKEQKRIVARIEELFSELGSGVETLKKTKQQLSVYRQAVLKAAFEGCETWEKHRFSDLMSEVRNGYGVKPDDSGKYHILKISAVRPLSIDLSESRLNKTAFCDEDTISENDILFTRYNGSRDYVGICAVVPRLAEAYAYPDKLIKCRPKIQNAVHSRFLAYYMSQGEARNYLRSKIKTTSGQNGISGADIKKAIVYLPDSDAQAKIVSRIESRLSVCDSIERTVDAALWQAESMRQSILKKAFEGKL